MSAEIDDKSIKEIEDFLKCVIQINGTLRKSNGVVDCNSIIKLLKCDLQNQDSGFESESISIYNDTCLVSTTSLKEDFCENKHLDLILEHSLITLCNFIQKANVDTPQNQSKNESVLEFVIEFIRFLAEISSNVSFREIILIFLDSMVTSALENESASMFNFTMELFHRFTNIQELRDCILDIIMKNLNIFSDSLNIEEVDATFSFHYETDFSRANTLLLTLLLIKKKYNCILSSQHDEAICNILQTFAKIDDFFLLGILSYNSLLRE